MKKNKKSIRKYFIIWSLAISLIPILIVVFYAKQKFEQSSDNELAIRLSGNAREISSLFSDLSTNLEKRAELYKLNSEVIQMLGSGASQSNSVGIELFKKDISNEILFFSRIGKLIFSYKKTGIDSKVEMILPEEEVFLTDEDINSLNQKEFISVVDSGVKGRLGLIKSTIIRTSNGKVVGYLEQIININEDFFKKLSDRLGLHFFVLDESGKALIGSFEDFNLYKDDQFESYIKNYKKIYNLNIRNEPFGFSAAKILWGDKKINLFIGSSKIESAEVRAGLNRTFYFMVIIISCLIVVVILFVSRSIMHPISDLIFAIEKFYKQGEAIDLPIKSDTEIGALTEAFNELTRSITISKKELDAKIIELEKANNEIKEAQAELIQSAKMAGLGQIVAGVAHELNNPLGYINSNLVLLKSYVEKLTGYMQAIIQNPQKTKEISNDEDFKYINEDLPKLLKSCVEGSERAKKIVQGLKNFSRADDGHFTEVDLEQVIENNLSLLSGVFTNEIIVKKNIEKKCILNCNENQINQVIINLLTNAAHAMHGHGKIEISAETIDWKNQKAVRIQISDSGTGISKENLNKIFDPFFTTKEVGKGTGLGLSVSYGIVQKHKGEIIVESELGIGSKFIVILPK